MVADARWSHGYQAFNDNQADSTGAIYYDHAMERFFL